MISLHTRPETVKTCLATDYRKQSTVRVILWGTYDLTKPRTRIMRASLISSGVIMHEIHTPVWSGVVDKSQLKGWFTLMWKGARWLLSYPLLMIRYLFAPDHDAVIVGYMGHLDVLAIAPLARLRGKPIVWDAFLSLYDTVVRDRQLLNPVHPLARLIFFFEKCACRCATTIVLDTRAHAALFAELYQIDASKLAAVFVGAEDDTFSASAPGANVATKGTLRVLFYGQFIPLHGIETIVGAARMTRAEDISWHIIGDGQEAAKIRKLTGDGKSTNIEWESWVPYHRLRDRIGAADICLGIFGTSDKASRVIPNKVFQILRAGRPLITRDSPAIRELLNENDEAIALILPGDAEALAEAVRTLAARLRCKEFGNHERLHTRVISRFAPAKLSHDWRGIVEQATRS